MDTLPTRAEECNPRTLLECFPRAHCERLYRHLHNCNGLHEYVMGFRDSDDVKQYKHARTVPANRAIDWSLNTTAGKAAKLFAFVPYASNDNAESVWGGMDFDAHDGNTARASRLAFAALALARQLPHTHVILEESGSGGYHLWCISLDFHPVAYWHGNLLAIAQTIGAEVVEGVCELRPLKASAARGSAAYGMRAPGSWNPGTKRLSSVLWHDCAPLLSTLADKERVVEGKRGRERKSFSSLGQLSERPTAFHAQFPIIQSATRHAQLRSMVGHIFFQVSVAVAEENAVAQFKAKEVETNADRAEHLRDFSALWCGMQTRWLAILSAAESAIYSQLVTAQEREGFRIVRGWHTLAIRAGKSDFALHTGSLGARLGMTRQGAEKMVGKLVRLGAIEEATAYIPNVRSSRYKWTV